MGVIGKLFVSMGLDTKDFVSGSKQVDKELSGIHKSVTSLSGGLKAIAGLGAAAFTGWGISKVADSFLDAAKKTENYRTRLTVFLGSAEEGNKVFKEMADYASRVPFEFENVMGAATQLAGVMKGGVKDIKQWMPLIGDLAAASGLSIEETTGQVTRMFSAGAASADLFRERGILAMLGFQSGVTYSGQETAKQLVAAWEDVNSKFRGATDKLAQTWEGKMSMIADAWFAFRNSVMESGAFDMAKGYLDDLLKKINEMKENGDLKKWAEETGAQIIEAFTIAKNTIEALAKSAIWSAEAIGTAWDYWFDAPTKANDFLKEQLSVYKNQLKEINKQIENLARPSFMGVDISIPEQDFLKGEKDWTAKKIGELTQLKKDVEQAIAVTEKSMAMPEKGKAPKNNPLAYEAAPESYNPSKKPGEFDYSQFGKGKGAAGKEAAAAKRAAKEKADALKDLDAMSSEMYQAQLESSAEFYTAQLEQRSQLEDSLAQMDADRLGRESEYMQYQLDAQANYLDEFASLSQENADLVADYRAGKERQITQMIQAENAARKTIIADYASNAIGSAADIVQAFAGQSKEGFALFKTLKVAETMISTYSAAQKAYESASAIPVIGHILGPVAAATAIASGFARVAQIQQMKLQGYAEGGIARAPQTAMVGERGPEAIIPLKNGSVPVQITQAGYMPQAQHATNVYVSLSGNTFLDQNQMMQSFASLAEVIAENVAVSAVVADYHNDGPVRQMVYGRL